MNPTTFTVQRGPEVYVYVLGRLVMKRHLDTNVSVTFHIAPRGVRWGGDGQRDSAHARQIAARRTIR